MKNLKKNKIMKKEIFFLFSILLIISFLNIVSAKGSLSVKTPSWNLEKQEKGTVAYIDDKNSKTPLICEVYPEAKNKNELSSKDVYTSKSKASLKEKETKNKLNQQEINGKWANCYKVTDEKYVQIGSNSTIYVYQDFSSVEYIEGDNNETVTFFVLKKFNGTDYNIEPENIWVKTEVECRALGKNGLCFGAIDNSMDEEDLAEFRYEINSTNRIYLIVNDTGEYSYPIFYTNFSLNSWGEQRQIYSFEDVCLDSYSDCEWSLNDNIATITFVSDYDIDPTIFPAGNGTIGNPYQITNCSLLQAMNESLTSYYKIMNNIDCSGISFNPILLGGIFSGGLDGQGYNISNFVISKDGSNRVGFFSDFSGTLSNVNIVNANVTGNYDVGVLVGYVRGGNITNSSVRNSIVTVTAGTGNGGIFVGRNFAFIKNSFVFNSSIIASSVSVSNVGGFVGQASSSNISDSGVDNVLVLASGSGVTAIGGFVGRAEAPFLRNYAINVNVSTGGNYIGGFVGNSATASAIMISSWSTGVVTAGGTYSGGFVGRNSAPILNCYSMANITSSADYVGGFIGYTSTSFINNSYSMGLVTRTVGGSYVGGFAGRNAGGTITSCYYDNQTSNQTDTGKGLGLNTTLMKRQASFVNWDFTTPVWYIIENQTYPSLIPLISGGNETNPYAILLNPLNNSYNNTNQNFTVNLSDAEGLSNATINVYNSTGLVNSTTFMFIGSVFNAVVGNVFSFIDGVYTWFVEVYDISSNLFITNNNTFTIDTLSPSVLIVYPVDSQFYGINISVLDYTLSDENLNQCWYSIDGGIINSSKVSGGINFTGVMSIEGNNDWQVWCDDDAGNIGSDEVFFIKDTIYPDISFVPITENNGSVLTSRNNIQINVTSSDANNVSNVTIYFFNETSLIYMIFNDTSDDVFVNFTGLDNGLYFFNATACDIVNNCNSTLTNEVLINVSSIIPTVTLLLPSNLYVTEDNLINFSFVPSDDINLSSCDLYGNWSGGWHINQTFFMPLNNFISSTVLNLSDGNYIWTVVCNDTDDFSSIPVNWTFSIVPPTVINVSDYTSILSVPSYPYVDANVSYPIKVYVYDMNNVLSFIGDLKINLTENGTTNSYNFSWDNVNKNYYTSFIFSEGDYPFVIYSTNLSVNLEETFGMFLVRVPYYVTFCGFRQEDDGTSTVYENDWAYLIAEFTTSKQFYNSNLEQFITPLGFATTFTTPVFHTLYRDGCGTFKLYEKDTEYAVRLFDGIATFQTVFSPPNITKTYGTNTYLERHTFNGTNSSYNVLLSEKDITPYRWLFNWIFIILIGGAVVVSIFLFFVIPDKPSLSVIFGLGFIGMLTLARVVLYIWKGF